MNGDEEADADADDRCPVVSIQSRFDTSRFDTNRSQFVTHVKSIRCKLKAFRYRSKIEKSSVEVC